MIVLQKIKCDICVYHVYLHYIHRFFHTFSYISESFLGIFGSLVTSAGRKERLDGWMTGGWWLVSSEINGLHPRRLTWIHPWKRKLIFQTIIFRFYVNLRGCKWRMCDTSAFHFFKVGLEAWNVNTLNESGAALEPLILIGNSNSADVGKATVFPCDLKSLLGMMRDMLRGRWTQSVQVLAPPGLFPFETGSHPSVCYRYCCWWPMQFCTTSKLLIFFKTEAISHGFLKIYM